MSFAYTFTPALEGPVRTGTVRVDAGAPYVGRVTALAVANLTQDGLAVRRAFLAYAVGTLVYLQGAEDDGLFLTLRLTGAPIPHVGYLVLPVTCTAASVSPLDGAAVDCFVLPSAASRALRDAATDPDLVTLERAKQHLNVTDTAHDAIVADTLTTASATIRDYLKGQNDPTWTPDTVPPWISGAVLLLLAHLYEHRGDEFGSSQDNDDRVWSAIGNLLRRSRDPALA